MKLGAEVFEAAAGRYLGAGLAGIDAAARAGAGPVGRSLADVAEAFLGWAAASAAVGRLYRKADHAASTAGGGSERSSRVRHSRVPSGR